MNVKYLGFGDFVVYIYKKFHYVKSNTNNYSMNPEDKNIQKQEAMDSIRENIEKLKSLEPDASIYIQNEHGSHSLMDKVLFMFQPKD